MRLLTILVPLLLTTSTLAVAATQVYRWTDKNGVTHFGGTPPPAGEKYDVLRPGGTPAAVPPGSNAATDSGSTPPIDAATQKFIEETDKVNAAKAEAQAKAKQAKAEAATQCAEARERKKFLEERTARRLVATNAEGQLERLPQDEFLKRVEEAQKAIDEHCR